MTAHAILAGIKVYKSSFIPLTNRDGKPVLFVKMQVPTLTGYLMPLSFTDGGPPVKPAPPMQTETVILVHPDRWDAFYMAINQPDVFTHPEVRALLLGQPEPQRVADELRTACEEP